jgi:predicted transcriptional regulator
MARVSKIKYNPSLSVAENARLNNCTVDAIRYYIRTRGIDRRYEGKMNIIEDIKKYLQVHPSAKKAEVARET